jgi:translation initiation factor 1A
VAYRQKPTKKKSSLTPEEQAAQEIRRIRLPRGTQCIGMVETRLGGSRMNVKCLDGNVRICRIPGRLKRALWVREGDFVIVEPWEFGGDTKGDILYKYRRVQVEYLKGKGYLKSLELSDF